MRNRAKLLLTALIGALVFGVAVDTASARRIETSNTGIRIAWAQMRFTNQTAAGGVEARCPVTMEGTFHSRTISKVSGQLIGYITSAHVNETAALCTYNGGAEHVRILNGNTGTGESRPTTLPWHIRYDSFTGTLPTIRTLKTQIINFGILLTAFGASCLFKSTAARPLFFYYFIAGTEGTPASIPLFEGGLLCPNSIFLEGVDAVTVLGTTTAIVFRLVA